MSGGVKGMLPHESPYQNHNWCSKCGEWKKGKPIHCPDCNGFTRYNVRRSPDRRNRVVARY